MTLIQDRGGGQDPQRRGLKAGTDFLPVRYPRSDYFPSAKHARFAGDRAVIRTGSCGAGLPGRRSIRAVQRAEPSAGLHDAAVGA